MDGRYNIEDSVGFLLAKAYQRGFALFRDRLAPYNVTPPQFSLLAFLWMEDGLSQATLSERSQIDRATMVGLVDRLEQEGYLERRPHKGDRRAHRVCLTAKGKSVEAALCGIAREVTAALTGNLSPAEFNKLRDILGKIRRL